MLFTQFRDFSGEQFISFSKKIAISRQIEDESYPVWGLGYDL